VTKLDSTQLDSGRFWLPNAPDQHVGGWVDLISRWPQVTLADPLTPAMLKTDRTTRPDGRVTIKSVPADDDINPDAFTVHGYLRRGPSRITLVNTTSAGRSMVLGGRGMDQGEQRLRADYAFIGGHVEGADTLFDRARLRVGHLDEWAGLAGLSTTVAVDGSQVRIEYTDPDEERAPVSGLGELVLGTVVTMPEPSVRGANLIRRAELTIELANALTFEEIWQRFVAPVSTLLSLCSDRDSGIVSLQLRTGPEERWLEARHPNIDSSLMDPGDRLASRDVLFTREVVTLDHAAQWLTRAPSWSPIPGMVAAIRTGSERTLANQLLDLATAAEGLHRRLPMQSRTISHGQARSARHAARDAVDPELSDRVNDALLHLNDPTYAERLHVVTDLAASAIPEAMGNRDQWEQRIKQVRNGFAHQVPTRSATDEWQEYLVLLRTMRWVLIIAMLNLAGVSPAALGERLRAYEPYRFQLRQARRWIPGLYPARRPDTETESPGTHGHDAD
jgi:hypothetical protein